MSDNVKWKFNPGLFGGGNYVLSAPDFFISYNPDTGNVGLSIFAGEDDGAETALCKGGEYYILNGDWRQDYERLLPEGFEPCLAFFFAKEAEHKSSWSNDPAISKAGE